MEMATVSEKKKTENESENEIKSEEKSASKEKKKFEVELEKAQKEIEKAKSEYDELNDKYVRMLAEYDNFRRRSAKEREGVYADAYCDVVSEILPILDNLERAAQYTDDAEKVSKGVQMTLKSMTDTLQKLGIEEVPTETFDPNYHNAVMHVEDDSLGEGVIVDVLQKGYKKGDKVIRYAMVKVAN